MSSPSSSRFRDERIFGDEHPAAVIDRQESRVVPQRIMTAKYLDMAVSATPRLLGIILRMRAILESTPEQRDVAGITDEDMRLAEAIHGTALSLYKHTSYQGEQGLVAVSVPFLPEDKELMHEWFKRDDLIQLDQLTAQPLVFVAGQLERPVEQLWQARKILTKSGLENLQTMFMRRMDRKIRGLVLKAYKMIDADDLRQAAEYSAIVRGERKRRSGELSESFFGLLD